jgi:flagellar biosynthesis GTPase FlhF
MATLKDASALTDELGALVRRLDERVAEGGDLLNLVTLADDVAELADSLATTFAAIDEELGRSLSNASAGTRDAGAKRQVRRSRGRSGPARAKAAEATDETAKSELVEQAKEAAITGRSSMSKEELAEAVEAQEELTKEELLERARALNVPGRSEMSKQQLLEALRKEESVSREELLERAKEADIPRRSEMSKDELRQALQSS